MSVVVGALVALAVVALAGPGARRGRSGAPGAPGRGVLSAPGRAVGHAGASRRRGPGRWRRTLAARTGQTDLAGMLHAVAAQVRAGVPPGAAWAAVLGSPVDRQVPEVDVVVAAVGGAREQRARVRAVVAGAHVAAETGAPLADVLEHLADAAAADAEQAGELAAALAGPRATARVLTSLPVLGLLVGSAMGARPWEVLTDGGLGSVLGAVGVALVVAGRAWVGALLRRAGAP